MNLMECRAELAKLQGDEAIATQIQAWVKSKEIDIEKAMYLSEEHGLNYPYF